jgi:hypothetical protein
MANRPSVDQRDAEDDELLEDEMDALPASDPVNGSHTGQTASRYALSCLSNPYIVLNHALTMIYSVPA